VQGRVSLICIIGKGGAVKSIEVKSGQPLLIKAATDAVTQWRFKPLLLNGEAAEVETAVNIDFQLPKAQKNPTPTKPSA
jgi:periplasmic protein TonB